MPQLTLHLRDLDMKLDNILEDFSIRHYFLGGSLLFLAIFLAMQIVGPRWFLLPVSFVCDTPNVTDACSEDCKKIWYDTDAVTLITEFDLICGYPDLKIVDMTVVTSGMFLGSFFGGLYIDWIGRQAPICAAIGGFILLGISSSLADSIWSFEFIRFFLGIAVGCADVALFVIFTEEFGARYRECLFGGLNISFKIGEMIIPTIAYYVGNWRNCIVLVTILSLSMLSVSFAVTESPRWLWIVKEDLSRTASALIDLTNNGSSDISSMKDKLMGAVEIFVGSKGSFYELFRNPQLRYKTITLSLSFFMSVSIVGVRGFQCCLTESEYKQLIISASIAICIQLIWILFWKYLGRILSVIIANTIAVFGFSIIICTYGSNLSKIAALVTESVLTMAWLTTLICAVEMMPTGLRGSGVGFLISLSFLCALVTLPIVYIVKEQIWTSYIYIFIVVAVAIAYSFLLETKGDLLCKSITNESLATVVYKYFLKRCSKK